MANAAPAWTFMGSSTEGERMELCGLNVWEHRWTLLAGQVADVKDPLYGQPYTFPVYAVTAGDTTVCFAAGEFSASVFGFYTLL